MDVFDVVDLIEKLKKRNVWVYMDNELLEEILINLYTLVLVHNNHYLLNQFITQTIPYLPNSHNNNLNMYLSAFGTVSAELIRESNSIVDSDDVVL